MKKDWIRLILVAAVVLVLPAALAARASAAGPTTLTLKASPGFEGRIQLQARLTGPDGKGLGMQKISFRMATSFFGERPLWLGEAVTDSAGIAALQFVPGLNGEQQYTVRFAGNGDHAPTEAAALYAVTGVSSAIAHSAGPSRLAPVWRLTGVAAAVVTVAIWAVLIFTLIRVRVGISHLGARPQVRPLPTMASSMSKGD